MTDAPETLNTYELITRTTVMKMLNFTSPNGFKKFINNTPDFPLPFPHKRGGRVYYFKIQILQWLKETEERLREEARIQSAAKIQALEEERLMKLQARRNEKEQQQRAFKEAMRNAELAAIKFREKSNI